MAPAEGDRPGRPEALPSVPRKSDLSRPSRPYKQATMSTRLSVCMLTCALGACLGTAQAQSPAEKLRSIHEAAQDSLLKEQGAAKSAIARLRAEAEDALIGWLRRGSGPSSKASSPGGNSQPETRPTGKAPGAKSKTTGSETASVKSEPSQSRREEEASPEEEFAVRDEASEEIRADDQNASSPPVPGPRRQAAAPYRPLLNRYARRRDLPRTLLYAIADAESFFDSTAVSSAGAVGLMQVHPPTGGRLAWAAVHGKAQTPSKTHLTTPENNVRLATKLLQLLLREYFGGVEEKWSRQLLATASYNAGASRVAEGLTPSGTIEAAVKLANRLAPRGVYERLRQTAPPETQTYVRRVFSRRTHYAPWRGEGEVVYGIPGRDRAE